MTTTRTIRLYAVGERVRIVSDANLPGRSGAIAGGPVCVNQRDRPPYLAYPIHLDSGFYSADRVDFITVMLVHHENLEATGE
jgi:hypothetical protein